MTKQNENESVSELYFVDKELYLVGSMQADLHNISSYQSLHNLLTYQTLSMPADLSDFIHAC